MTHDVNALTGRLQSALAAAKRAGADAAKVACAQSEEMNVVFEAGRLKDTGGGQSFGHTVEVLAKRRRCRASGTLLANLDRTVAQAASLVHLGSNAHFEAWPAPAPYAPVQIHSSRAALTREQLISACERMVEPLKSHDPELFISCQAQRVESEGVMVTSGGVVHASASTLWMIGGFVQRTRDADMLMAYDSRAWREVNEYFDPDAITARILQRLQWAERSAAPPAGATTVFLPPEVLNMFLAPLYLGISGRRVAKGESPLADKIGTRVLAPCLTITDEPHRAFSPGAADADGDGIPTRRQTLVANGVLQRFLYDLDSAGLAGAEPSGNDQCLPYDTVIARGTRSSEQLLRGIRDGLYLTGNLIGFGQSNMLNGDFSCNVGLGYRIQNGEIVGRVKDTMVAGNLYEILNGTVELSSDADYDGATPYAVVEGVTVSA